MFYSNKFLEENLMSSVLMESLCENQTPNGKQISAILFASAHLAPLRNN